jgi:hypothetical protein
MIKKIIELTFSASNVHGVVDDNNNSYRNMVMDMMKMNQDHVGECPIIDEEPDANATRFFDLLKDFDGLFGMVAQNTINYW